MRATTTCSSYNNKQYHPIIYSLQSDKAKILKVEESFVFFTFENGVPSELLYTQIEKCRRKSLLEKKKNYISMKNK